VIRLLHILSSALMFGVGVGALWFVTTAAMSRHPAVLAVTTRNAFAAEMYFGVPVAIVQPLTGYLLMRQLGYGFDSIWFWSVAAAYSVTGIAWVYLVKSEFRLRRMTAPMSPIESLPGFPAELARARALAAITLTGVVILFWLMVFRPGLQLAATVA
jgi:uncharacterized membrane protein